MYRAPFLTGLMVLCTLCVCGGNTCDAESPRTIKRHGPLRFPPHEIRGKAEIPKDVRFGLMCDIDGVIQSGDWKVIGTVTGHEPGLITFTTEEFSVKDKIRNAEKPGRLAYRLPHDLVLPLERGDPITLMHDQDSDEKRLEWEIHVSSGRELIFATAHQHDDTPPQSAESAEVLFDGAPGGHLVFFWSDPDANDRIQDLKSVKQSSSPVTLRVRDDDQLKQIDAEHGAQTRITLDGTDYIFVVLSSDYLEHDSHGDHAESGSESVGSESKSHSMECFLVKASKSNRR